MALEGAFEELSKFSRDRDGLCLLSFGKLVQSLTIWAYPTDRCADGGGVRGLSSLLVLQSLMHAVNNERKKHGDPSVKPCELFDLIGGTSTGGFASPLSCSCIDPDRLQPHRDYVGATPDGRSRLHRRVHSLGAENLRGTNDSGKTDWQDQSSLR